LKPTHERQTYHAMVDFADAAIGNFTAAVCRHMNIWLARIFIDPLCP
jgi:hypothetical protein